MGPSGKGEDIVWCSSDLGDALPPVRKVVPPPKAWDSEDTVRILDVAFPHDVPSIVKVVVCARVRGKEPIASDKRRDRLLQKTSECWEIYLKNIETDFVSTPKPEDGGRYHKGIEKEEYRVRFRYETHRIRGRFV